MGYQSKTWSLSDEVVAAFEKARDERGLSPNKYLLQLIELERIESCTADMAIELREPPARELLVELDGDGK